MIHTSYAVLLREKNGKLSYLTMYIAILICEPVYGTYTDVIKSPSNGTGVNMAPGINET